MIHDLAIKFAVFAVYITCLRGGGRRAWFETYSVFRTDEEHLPTSLCSVFRRRWTLVQVAHVRDDKQVS